MSTDTRCKHCGGPIVQEGGLWVHVDSMGIGCYNRQSTVAEPGEST